MRPHRASLKDKQIAELVEQAAKYRKDGKARIESILNKILGVQPKGGRWTKMRSLSKYIIEGKDNERSMWEIIYNWGAKEGLAPKKAEELCDHLITMTGPNDEPICEMKTIRNVDFIKWVFGMEEEAFNE